MPGNVCMGSQGGFLAWVATAARLGGIDTMVAHFLISPLVIIFRIHSPRIVCISHDLHSFLALWVWPYLTCIYIFSSLLISCCTIQLLPWTCRMVNIDVLIDSRLATYWLNIKVTRSKSLAWVKSHKHTNGVPPLCFQQVPSPAPTL